MIGRNRRNAWQIHGRLDCGREVEASTQVQLARHATFVGDLQLKEHVVLLLGVLNDDGPRDREVFLSHGLTGVTAYGLIIQYTSSYIEFATSLAEQ